MVGSSPEGHPVVHRDREVVTGVSVNGLEEPHGDPDVDSQDVKVLGKSAEEERSADGTSSENEDFERMSVLSGETKGRREFVMLLVDVLVEWTPMQSSMHPVVIHVFKEEEETNLPRHRSPVREGHRVGGKSEVLAKRVEGPNLRQLDCEMSQENVLCALPLLSRCGNSVFLDLVFAHRWHRVDDDPGNGSAKVDDF